MIQKHSMYRNELNVEMCEVSEEATERPIPATIFLITVAGIRGAREQRSERQKGKERNLCLKSVFIKKQAKQKKQK